MCAGVIAVAADDVSAEPGADDSAAENPLVAPVEPDDDAAEKPAREAEVVAFADECDNGV